MPLSKNRWNVITPSAYEWERDALEYVRNGLPEREPYVAWTNFDFVADDGSVSEVDLLILAPGGLFLVEIKSRPGILTGDAGTWTWLDERGGTVMVEDNPLLLANRKAKKLKSLLARQKTWATTRGGSRVAMPYLEAVVFCSASGLKSRLDDRARHNVYFRVDPGNDSRQDPRGILKALDAELQRDRPAIDYSVKRALCKAVEQAGIRPSQRMQRVGDYVLDKVLAEGPGYQDFEATHVTMKSTHRRARRYLVATGAGTVPRESAMRAARREFQIHEGIEHPGILRVLEYKEDDRGPVLIFEHFPKSLRLDHHVVKVGDRLGADVRLHILRQIAEALQYAHGKHMAHRALSPQSVLVLDPDAPRPRIKIFNWQTGRRDSTSTAANITRPTSHIGELIEDAASVYLAPEALRDPHGDAEAMDVFSFGAVAYFLFTGQPPAEGTLQLAERLRVDGGLSLPRVMDGAGEELELLVRCATDPDVDDRLTLPGLMEQLDAVEDEMTRPEPAAQVDPLEAKPGDLLPTGHVVERRLGTGSCALALLCNREGREEVLKVSLGPDHDDRVRAEGEVVRQLHHARICAFHETVEIGGRVVLVLAKAGDKTLREYLRNESQLHIDLLERFGDDLLDAIEYLDGEGIAHRDVKPENLAVSQGSKKKLHLVLFDFSLSRTPAENIRAGTVPYLDPFLTRRKAPRWDVHAERFAVAMTLHEMATGRLPVWGAGSDPALIDDEVTIDGNRFDPDLRESMVAFFKKALRRDYADRFGSTEDMRRGWRGIFARLERADSTAADAHETTKAIPPATLHTQLAHLGVSSRALNALERANLLTVGDLLSTPAVRFKLMPGVGHKTRTEILQRQQELAAIFPDVPVVASTPAVVPHLPEESGAEDTAPDASSVDLIAESLVPAGKGQTQGHAVLRAVLELDVVKPTWPSQTEVAHRSGKNPAMVSQVIAKARERWSRNKAITRLRADVVELLTGSGGVMTASELTLAVLESRGSTADEPRRTALASAVARAAVETEKDMSDPRFVVRRSGTKTILALSSGLADYTVRLGQVADDLSGEQPIPGKERVLEALRKIRRPEDLAALSDARLVTLGAAASATAAVSGRLELYPRGMPAKRALELAHGTLLLPKAGVALLKDRVAGRYPEAEPLPDRPQLDELLRDVGSALAWSEDEQAFTTPQMDVVSSATSHFVRRPTAPATDREASPEAADARRFEERLDRTLVQGGLLVLTVAPRRMRDAERELARRFAVERVSLERVIIDAMKAQATEIGARWDVVVGADADGSSGAGWRNLSLLVGRAVAKVEQPLLSSARPLLLVNGGLLARFDRLDLVEKLRDAAGRPGMVRAAWLLVPSDDRSLLPMMDGKAVPVIGPSQWARIPEAWIDNRHRAGGTPITTSQARIDA